MKNIFVISSLLMIQTSFCMQLFLKPVSSLAGDEDLKEYTVIENIKCMPHIFDKKKFKETYPLIKPILLQNGFLDYTLLKTDNFTFEMQTNNENKLNFIQIEDHQKKILLRHYFPLSHEDKAHLEIVFKIFERGYRINNSLEDIINYELSKRKVHKGRPNTSGRPREASLQYIFPCTKLCAAELDCDWLYLIWKEQKYYIRSLIHLPKAAFRDYNATPCTTNSIQNTASEQPGWLATITGFLASTSINK